MTPAVPTKRCSPVRSSTGELSFRFLLPASFRIVVRRPGSVSGRSGAEGGPDGTRAARDPEPRDGARPNSPSYRVLLAPLTERYSPRSPYSASKAASDHLARAYHHTYGPYQFSQKLIPLEILNMQEGKSPTSTARGKTCARLGEQIPVFRVR